MSSLLDTKVLVLNRSWLPIGLCTVKDAYRLASQNVADIMNKDLEPFDWDSWLNLKVEDDMQSIGTVYKKIRIPRIIRLHEYNKIPDRVIRFNRSNVMARDKYICQYCGTIYTATQLNMDHVKPRSRGGKTTWTNIVASCHTCNSRKADKTPREANMKLIREPFRPKWTPHQIIGKRTKIYPEWKIFFEDMNAPSSNG